MNGKINTLSMLGTILNTIEIAVDELSARNLTPGRNIFFQNLNMLEIWKNVKAGRSQLSKAGFNIIRSEINRLNQDIGRRFDQRILE